jgi:hypothetical protein
MYIRANLILACAGLILAVVVSTPSAGANLLVDPEFDGLPPLNTLLPVFGPPFITGQWGAENGAILGVDGGVTPLTATTMLAEYYTGSYTQTIQVTDISADPPLSAYSLSAYFNANQNLPAAHAFVNVSFYDAAYVLLSAPPSVGLVLDNNTSTWQQISVTATGPLSAKYIVSQVLYDDSTLIGVNGATYPGYVDSASLTLVPEPGSILLLVSGLAGLVLYAWRKKT